MKPLYFIFVLAFSLCATLCCPEEEDFANTFVIENENLIRIEDNTDTFNLNDQITIITEIPNSQTDVNGNTVLLSNLFYNDVLNESFFQHSLTLYRQTGFGTLSEISVLEEDIQNNIGETLTNNSFIITRSFYDATTDSFISSYSITLRETGTFYLSDNRLAINDFRGIFLTGGIYELGFADIKTSIQNANMENAYEFTVTE